MNKLILIVLFVLVGHTGYLTYTSSPGLAFAGVLSSQPDNGDSLLADAYKHRTSKLHREGQGTILYAFVVRMNGIREVKMTLAGRMGWDGWDTKAKFTNSPFLARIISASSMAGNTR